MKLQGWNLIHRKMQMSDISCQWYWVSNERLVDRIKRQRNVHERVSLRVSFRGTCSIRVTNGFDIVQDYLKFFRDRLRQTSGHWRNRSRLSDTISNPERNDTLLSLPRDCETFHSYDPHCALFRGAGPLLNIPIRGEQWAVVVGQSSPDKLLHGNVAGNLSRISEEKGTVRIDLSIVTLSTWVIRLRWP